GVLEQADDERRDRLIELEHDVADEAIADDDVDRSAITSAGREIATFDIADEVDPGRLQELVRLLDDGVALLRFFADAEQADGGIVASEDVFGVDDAEPGELRELVGGAIDVRARVEHDDRLSCR